MCESGGEAAHSRPSQTKKVFLHWLTGCDGQFHHCWRLVAKKLEFFAFLRSQGVLVFCSVEQKYQQ